MNTFTKNHTVREFNEFFDTLNETGRSKPHVERLAAQLTTAAAINRIADTLDMLTDPKQLIKFVHTMQDLIDAEEAKQ